MADSATSSSAGITPFSLLPESTAEARWGKWLARLDNYLTAVNITSDGRKRAQLLHHAGEDVFGVYLALGSTSTSYSDLKDELTDYFAPSRNPEYEVYLFRQERQNQEETVDAFAARLRHMAKYCDFHIGKEVKSQLIQQ